MQSKGNWILNLCLTNGMHLYVLWCIRKRHMLSCPTYVVVVAYIIWYVLLCLEKWFLSLFSLILFEVHFLSIILCLCVILCNWIWLHKRKHGILNANIFALFATKWQQEKKNQTQRKLFFFFQLICCVMQWCKSCAGFEYKCTREKKN